MSERCSLVLRMMPMLFCTASMELYCRYEPFFFISFYSPSHGSAHVHSVCKFLFGSSQTLQTVPTSFLKFGHCLYTFRNDAMCSTAAVQFHTRRRWVKVPRVPHLKMTPLESTAKFVPTWRAGGKFRHRGWGFTSALCSRQAGDTLVRFLEGAHLKPKTFLMLVWKK